MKASLLGFYLVPVDLYFICAWMTSCLNLVAMHSMQVKWPWDTVDTIDTQHVHVQVVLRVRPLPSAALDLGVLHNQTTPFCSTERIASPARRCNTSSDAEGSGLVLRLHMQAPRN